MVIGDSAVPELGAPAGKKSDNPRALHEAAEQFEAFLIAQMLRSARESGGPDQSAGSDSASESAMGMAEDAFAKALSQSGGLGLAQLVEASVKRASSHPPPAPASQQVSE